MKYIITEEQNLKIKVLRRLSAVDFMLNNLSNFSSGIFLNLCKYDFDDVFTMIIQWACENMYYDYFGDLEDDSEEWAYVHSVIVKYIETYHSETVKDFYDKKCN